jgi:predicted NUDIX family phosphoesterase
VGLDESILIVPRRRLMPDGDIDGFVPGDVGGYLAAIRRFGEFRRRGDVEEDPSCKQIIPYLIIRHHDRLFLFQRSEQGDEVRLRGLYSIGVGGHISRQDLEGTNDPLWAGLERELHEELVIAPGWSARPVGILNEEDTPVSRVHFGLVFLVDTEDAGVRVREEDRLSGRLAGVEEVRAVRPRMESWSQRVLDVADPFTL